MLWFLALPAVFSWRRQTIVTLLGVVVLCFGVGLWRGSATTVALRPYRELSKQKVTIVGIAQEDGAYGSREQLSFTLGDISLVVPYTARLPGIVSVSGFGAGVVHRGDVVQATGKFWPTLGGNQSSISFAELQVVHRPAGFLEQVRRQFDAGLESALPEPLASFGLGLLIGQRNTLPGDVSQVLLMVGLTHIIAVSGYNLTIILRAARKIFGKRSKFQTAALGVSLMLVFLAIAGASPSIVRAVWVSSLSLAAWYYGREIKPLPLLLLAAAVSALINPLYLDGNVSWCLSFLAFFGVMILAPLITRRIFGGSEPKLLVAVAIESLCAEAMTLPYVLHIFGQLSFVSLLANVLVVAWVPLAMLLVLIAGLAGMFAAPFVGWLAWPARLLLTYMLDVAGALSRIPHAFVQNRSFSSGAMAGSYAIVAAFVLILWQKSSKSATITGKKTETEGVAEHERTFQMVYD